MKLNIKRGSISKKLKRLDLFGHPITLKYKDQSTFQSTFGGLFTIIVVSGILGYFLMQLKATINKEQFQVINSLSKRTISTDKTEDNFDIGLFMFYNGDQEIQDNLDLYFSYQIQQAYQRSATTAEELKEFGNSFQLTNTNAKLQLCDESRFGGLKDAVDLGIANHYYCPPSNFSFTLQGGYSSVSTQFFFITVDYCSQTYLNERFPGMNKTCKLKNEAIKVLGKMQIFVSVMTSYFDQQEFSSNPIKKQINNDIFILLQKNISQTSIYKLSQNNAILQDSWFSNLYNNQNLSFIDMRFVTAVIGEAGVDESFPLQSISFMLDENISTVNRSVYTIFDVISQTGGFMGVVFAFGTYLIGWIQEFLFNSSIIKRMLYQQKSNSDIQTRRSKGQRQLVAIQVQSNAKNNNQNIPNLSSIFSENSNNSMLVEEYKMDNTDNFAQNYYQRTSKQHLELGKINKITKYVSILQPFKYDFKKFLRYNLRNLIGSCNSKRKVMTEDLLYNIGVSKIQNQFDIVHIFKQIKKIDLLTQISLSRYQQFFLPILRNNVLSLNESSLKQSLKQDSNQTQDDTSPQLVDTHNSTISKNETLFTIDQKRLNIFIQQLALKSHSSKIDKRILKNLIFQEDQAEDTSKYKDKIESKSISAAVTDKYSNQLQSQFTIEDKWDES